MDDPGLAQAVQGVTLPGVDAAQIGDVDDQRGLVRRALSGRILHQAGGVLGAQKRAAQIGLHHVLPIRDGGFIKRALEKTRRAVHPDIQMAELRFDGREQALDLGRIAQIRVDGDRSHTQGADFGHGRTRGGFRAAVMDDHMRAGSRQRQRDRLADPVRAACNRGDFVVQIHVFPRIRGG